MSTIVHRFVLASTESDVPFARRKVIDQVRTWGVPMDDEKADAIRLVASDSSPMPWSTGRGLSPSRSTSGLDPW